MSNGATLFFIEHHLRPNGMKRNILQNQSVVQLSEGPDLEFQKFINYKKVHFFFLFFLWWLMSWVLLGGWWKHPDIPSNTCSFSERERERPVVCLSVIQWRWISYHHHHQTVRLQPFILSSTLPSICRLAGRLTSLDVGYNKWCWPVVALRDHQVSVTR